MEGFLEVAAAPFQRRSRTSFSKLDGEEPGTHHGTQIDANANADSQLTTIDDSQSRSSEDSANSGVDRPALDFYTVFSPT